MKGLSKHNERSCEAGAERCRFIVVFPIEFRTMPPSVVTMREQFYYPNRTNVQVHSLVLSLMRFNKIISRCKNINSFSDFARHPPLHFPNNRKLCNVMLSGY